MKNLQLGYLAWHLQLSIGYGIYLTVIGQKTTCSISIFETLFSKIMPNFAIFVSTEFIRQIVFCELRMILERKCFKNINWFLFCDL